MSTRVCSLSGAGLSTAALLASLAVPASAAVADTSRMALVGGTLSIAVQPSAVLTTGSAGSGSVTGQLGTVTVTDDRGTLAWSANATSTTFTRTGGGSTSTGVTYNAGTITTTGIVVMPPAATRTLNATATKVVGPTAITGNNTATWNPTLTVSLPTNALAGPYSGTINTSVS